MRSVPMFGVSCPFVYSDPEIQPSLELSKRTGGLSSQELSSFVRQSGRYLIRDEVFIDWNVCDDYQVFTTHL